MMNEQSILERRTRRIIKQLLCFKEEVVDIHLPEQVQAELRERILDSLNELCNLATDLMSPNVNDLYIEKLDQILDRINADE